MCHLEQATADFTSQLGNEPANGTLLRFSKALRQKVSNFSSEIRVWGALKISLRAMHVYSHSDTLKLWPHCSPLSISKTEIIAITTVSFSCRVAMRVISLKKKKKRCWDSQVLCKENYRSSRNVTLLADVQVCVWAPKFPKFSFTPSKQWRQLSDMVGKNDPAITSQVAPPCE